MTGAPHGPSDPIEPATPSPARFVAAAVLALAAFAALAALGTWQVHRLFWKLDLIARVEARVGAPATPPPGPSRWAAVTADADAYRHVAVTGTYLNDRETLVQATTEYGAGYWLVTPLRTAEDGIVLVNRGFLPPEAREPGRHPVISGPTTVTGLLRVSEPKGMILRPNEPQLDRWSSRDVAAIAGRRGLSDVAPYFIDADATPNPGGVPIGGLTVVRFPNNHLIYAVTWYSLAAMLAGAGLWAARERWRQRSLPSAAAPQSAGQPAGVPGRAQR